MKNIEEIKKILTQHKQQIREEYGVVILGIFGSYARSEQTPVSDIDILMELEKPVGFKFFELWDMLEKMLNVKVDLITIKAAKQKPMLWKSMKEDLVHV